MQSFLDPNKILNELDLRDNMIAAEFGCGPGGWAIPLAQRLEKGKVFALDIQPEKLSALKNRAESENVLNIETKQCDLEKVRGSGLPDNFLDLVLIPNVLFQTEKKDVIIGEAKRVLKKEGRLLIVDWMQKAKLGPKEERVTRESVKEIAKNLDLELKKEFEAGIYHYGLIFEKQ